MSRRLRGSGIDDAVEAARIEALRSAVHQASGRQNSTSIFSTVQGVLRGRGRSGAPANIAAPRAPSASSPGGKELLMVNPLARARAITKQRSVRWGETTVPPASARGLVQPSPSNVTSGNIGSNNGNASPGGGLQRSSSARSRGEMKFGTNASKRMAPAPPLQQTRQPSSRSVRARSVLSWGAPDNRNAMHDAMRRLRALRSLQTLHHVQNRHAADRKPLMQRISNPGSVLELVVYVLLLWCVLVLMQVLHVALSIELSAVSALVSLSIELVLVGVGFGRWAWLSKELSLVAVRYFLVTAFCVWVLPFGVAVVRMVEGDRWGKGELGLSRWFVTNGAVLGVGIGSHGLYILVSVYYFLFTPLSIEPPSDPLPPLLAASHRKLGLLPAPLPSSTNSPPQIPPPGIPMARESSRRQSLVSVASLGSLANASVAKGGSSAEKAPFPRRTPVPPSRTPAASLRRHRKTTIGTEGDWDGTTWDEDVEDDEEAQMQWNDMEFSEILEMLHQIRTNRAERLRKQGKLDVEKRFTPEQLNEIRQAEDQILELSRTMVSRATDGSTVGPPSSKP